MKYFRVSRLGSLQDHLLYIALHIRHARPAPIMKHANCDEEHRALISTTKLIPFRGLRQSMIHSILILPRPVPDSLLAPLLHLCLFGGLSVVGMRLFLLVR